jgi:hypothetical protein
MANGCNELDTGDSRPAGLATINIGSNIYVLVNYSGTGTFGNPKGFAKRYAIDANTGEPDIANAVDSGISRASKPLILSQINNNTIAYTAQQWGGNTGFDSLSVATVCNFNSQLESFTDCINTTLNPTDAYTKAEQVGVLSYKNNTYVYYGMRNNPMYICSTDNASGAITSCRTQSITSQLYPFMGAYGSAFASF